MHVGRPRRRRSTLAGALIAATAVLASLVTLVSPPATVVVEAAGGGQASKYVAIAPIRVLDTRDPGYKRLPGGDTLSVNPLTPDVLAAAGVDPLDVEAVAINLSMTQEIAAGWLRSLPTGLAISDEIATAAVNNAGANDDITNVSIVPVGASGLISIYTLQSTHVVVDVQGVFVRATSSRAGRFVPLPTPTRAVDTRDTSTPLGADTSRLVDLTAVGIPSTASAAIINIVATETQNGGYLTAYPGGTVPYTSNLNYPGGNHTIAAGAITRLDNGKLRIYSSAATHLVVDVVGYMTGDSDTDSAAGLFVSIPPERHYDSRSSEWPYGTSPLAPGTSRSLQVAGALNVPADGVIGIASNLTMTNPDRGGYLVMYPESPLPEDYASVNSAYAGQTIGNHAIAALDDDGAVRVFSLGQSDYIVDITGYFIDGSNVPTTPPRTATDPAPATDVDPTRPAYPGYSSRYSYLIEAEGSNAPYGAYSNAGRRYYGWQPCEPITYAVNTERATQEQIDAMNRAIRTAETASGIDLVYVGEATGNLELGSIDPRVPGGTTAMAVIGFSDPYATPILDGSTIGIGGVGRSVLSSGSMGSAVAFDSSGQTAWVVRGGFALVDITDVIDIVDLEYAFAHEIAHMIGLGHVTSRSEVMYQYLPTSPLLAYGSGDRYGLYSIGEPQCTSGAALTANEPLTAEAPAAARDDIDVTYYVADEADH